jgi:hypothetical protein
VSADLHNSQGGCQSQPIDEETLKVEFVGMTCADSRGQLGWPGVGIYIHPLIPVCCWDMSEPVPSQ